MGGRAPVVVLSNVALITGLVVVAVGAIARSTLVVIVGIFLLAVAVGLAVVNRSQRRAGGR